MSYKMNLSTGENPSNFMSKIKSAGSAFSMTTIMYIVAAILFILIADLLSCVHLLLKW